MILLVRVNALAPKDQQTVIAVEPRHFGEQGILHGKQLCRHQGCHGIRGIEDFPGIIIQVFRSREVAGSIPRRIAYGIFTFGLEPFNHQAVRIGIGIIIVVTPTVFHQNRQAVLGIVTVFDCRIDPHRIVIRHNSCMAFKQGSSYGIDSIRRFQPNLQLAQVLVLVIGTNYDVIAHNGARKFVRLVVFRLVGRARPLEPGSRRPRRIVKHAQQRGGNIIAKMHIGTLQRTRTATGIVAINCHHHAIAVLRILLNIRSQVDGIKNGRRTGRKFEAVRCLINLVIIDRL